MSKCSLYLTAAIVVTSLAGATTASAAVVLPRIEPQGRSATMTPLRPVERAAPERALTLSNGLNEFGSSDATHVLPLQQAKSLEVEEVSSTMSELVPDK